MNKRDICVVTVGRSDFGIYQPILRALRESKSWELTLLATGGHYDVNTGHTIDLVKETISEPLREVSVDSFCRTPVDMARTMGAITAGTATALAEQPPDLLLVLGDRFDMFAAALAAVPLNIPLAHIHGGESTEGAIDDQFRHALTKLSHLHFASTEVYAQRIIQMGEEPWRVTASGAPGLDNLNQLPILSRDKLEQELNLTLTTAPILITYHPESRTWQHTENQLNELLQALAPCPHPQIFTCPNVDAGSSTIVRILQQHVTTQPNCRLVPNLGARRYFSLLHIAAAMVGNSSSGIIEAASFKLPVVNIGDRQKGRIHPHNVITIPCKASDISRALEKALAPGTRAALQHMTNPYGDGHAADRIVKKLCEIRLDASLLRKPFYSPSIQEHTP